MTINVRNLGEMGIEKEFGIGNKSMAAGCGSQSNTGWFSSMPCCLVALMPRCLS